MDSPISEITSGNVRALARAITAVENRTPRAKDLVRALYPKGGNATVIGITGSPGSGKSTLVNRMAVRFAEPNARVGVVVVDPSSPYSGGAILGDRIRMRELEQNPAIFVRSMATRGHLGGLAPSTADVVTVLDAAGRDPVIVETVGVGQDEIDVVRLADISIVVLVPGMGDDVQALKAGIMEIGDIFVINKCDNPGADAVERALTAMMALAPEDSPRSRIPIVRTTATTGEGLERLLETIGTTRRAPDPELKARRRSAAEARVRTLLQERLVQETMEHVFSNGEFHALVDAVVRRERDPYSVVDTILERIRFGGIQ